MSNLPGHTRITKQAVLELSTENPRHPIYSVLGAAGLPLNVVARDIIDVLILGHWADFGQCHHFMRRFDGQSERDAYDEAVRWIQTNALEAAKTMASQIHIFFGASGLPAGPEGPTDLRGDYVLSGRPVTRTHQSREHRPSWQSLGNAIHCAQDSFAWGHVEREASPGPGPGAIRRVKRYAGTEKDGHAEADELWWDQLKGGFSKEGRLAIDATKSLLRVVVETAASAKGNLPAGLSGFTTFTQTYLVPSASLSKARDEAFDLIDSHYTGIRLGASNTKTISMDEEGLASALIDAGTNMDLVHSVFERLDEHYNSDADDVAERYVKKVRARSGMLENALRSNRRLIARLIKVMDEGWTASGERECIDYLKGL